MLLEETQLDGVEPTERECRTILPHLTRMVEELYADAAELADDLTRDAEDEYREMMEARRGQY